MQGGEPDVNAAAKMILNDFQRGKLPYFVKPPDMVLYQLSAPPLKSPFGPVFKGTY